MLRLRGRAAKGRAARLHEAPFPGEAPRKEPEQTRCSGSPVEQGAALAAVGALPEQGSDALRFGFLDPTSGSTTQELLCNRTRELKENGESPAWPFAAWGGWAGRRPGPTQERSPSGQGLLQAARAQPFLAPECSRPAEHPVSWEHAPAGGACVSALCSVRFLCFAWGERWETWAASRGSCLLGSAVLAAGP